MWVLNVNVVALMYMELGGEIMEMNIIVGLVGIKETGNN
jgi:hypothetical protein